MSDIDEMSRSMGHLEGDVRTLTKEFVRHMEQEQKNLDKLYSKIDAIAKDVNELKNFKSRIVGGLIVVGTFSALVAAWVKGLFT